MRQLTLKHEHIRLCPDCDLVVSVPDIQNQQQAHCPRCFHLLETSQPLHVQRLLALVVTALLLYFPAILYPMLSMELAGQTHNSSILDGVRALWNEGFTFVAVLVALSAILIPFFRLLVLLPVLSAAHWRRARWPARRLFRRYIHLCEWGMVEIYMLGVLVSVIKLADMASIHFGAGLFCYTGLMLAEIGITLNLNEQRLWQRLGQRLGQASGEHP